MNSKKLLFFYLLLLLPFLGLAQLKFTSKKTGLGTITDITHANDGSGRIFVANKAGIIYILDSAYNTVGTLLDISIGIFISTSGEKGLLGLAFHPNFASNGYFFVNYNPFGTNHTRIARFTSLVPSSNTAASILTQKVILTITTATNSNHKAGDLAFSPLDGYLYITTGDGGGSGDPQLSGQNSNSLLAKILRIDINTNLLIPYAIPADNPFASSPGFLPEIWDMGLRNPWRISFDRQTSELWIADVGQGAREEINVEAPNAGGNNYGWNCREGFIGFSACSTSVFIDPIFDYSHCSGGCLTKGFGNSITGGFVYRGSNNVMKGFYLFADYVSKHGWAIRRTGGPGSALEVKTIANLTPAGVTSFGEIQNGEILAGLETGNLGLIEATTALPISLMQFNGQWSGNSSIELKWNTASEYNTLQYQLEKSKDGTNFTSIGKVTAHGRASEYKFVDHQPNKTKNYYRLKIEDQDGAFNYSNILLLQNIENKPFAYYRAGLKEIQLPVVKDSDSYQIELYTSHGIKIKHAKVTSDRLSVQDIPKGIYFLRMEINQAPYTQKMVIY